MNRLIGAFGLILCAAIAGAPLAQNSIVDRSSLFVLQAGDVIEDSGVLTVPSGRFSRTEAFEVVRHADGGRTVTSIINGKGTQYRVEGRWTYDVHEKAISAIGKGRYKDTPAVIEIHAQPPVATIAVSYGEISHTVQAPCDPSCLIDMAPSALTMFTMTRQFNEASGGIQRFNWIAQSLTADQILIEGHADIRKLGSQRVGSTEVLQFLFVETITNAQSGVTASFAFNLYVDGKHRPLAFATQGDTIGTRDGFETLLSDMPPMFDD